MLMVQGYNYAFWFRFLSIYSDERCQAKFLNKQTFACDNIHISNIVTKICSSSFYLSDI